MNKNNITVLIADDSPFFQKKLEDLVQSLNYEVISIVDNGEKAIDFVKTNHPDLILLDINMPKKSGVKALPEIIDLSPESIVIMVTSVSDTSTVNECMDLGASNYILKDSHNEEIGKIIINTLDINGII